MKRYLAACAAVVLAFAVSAPAAAVNGLTVYTSRDAFMAALSHVAVDTFDDLPTTDDLPESLDRSVGGYSYNVTTMDSTQALYRAGTADNGSLSTFNAESLMLFWNFSGGVNAVGGDFYATYADGSTAPTLDLSIYALTIGDGHPYLNDWHSITLTNDSPSTFVGLVWDVTQSPYANVPNTPYFFVSQTHLGADTWPTVDNLTFGIAATGPVPEPASWAMMLVGFGAVGAAMRRRGRPAIA